MGQFILTGNGLLVGVSLGKLSSGILQRRDSWKDSDGG